MRKALFSIALLVSCGLQAQTATDENLGSRVFVDTSTSTPVYNFTWWGKTGFHYIVQSSTDLLSPWAFFENFNPSGADSVLGIGISPEGGVLIPKLFFRVYQFDPSNLSTLPDTDNDGLPDIWENFHLGGLGFNSTDDNEPDGFSNLEEVVAGTKPDQAPDASSAAVLNLSVWTPFR